MIPNGRSYFLADKTYLTIIYGGDETFDQTNHSSGSAFQAGASNISFSFSKEFKGKLDNIVANNELNIGIKKTNLCRNGYIVTAKYDRKNGNYNVIIIQGVCK